MRYLIIINIILVTFLIKLFKKNKKLFAQYGAAKEMKLHYKELFELVSGLLKDSNNKMLSIKEILREKPSKSE